MENALLTETDQIDCFDAAGTKIDCTDTGQDGSLERSGTVAPGQRFRTAGDGIVDRRTGLVWMAQAGLDGFPLTWAEAVEAAASRNDAAVPGAGRWRLPTRRELFSLISHQHVNPALPPGHPFTDVFNGYYWTVTRCARLPAQAWYVHMGGGKVYRGMTQGSYLVWPVSGPEYGTITPENRFSPAGDTMVDRATGRHWYVGRRLPGAPICWMDAFQAVRRLNASRPGGFSDWRLPAIRELESIVDDTRHSPALADGLPVAGDDAAGFWSSTTSIYEPRYAWVLYPLDGAVGVGFKSQADFHVTAVRGGSSPQAR